MGRPAGGKNKITTAKDWYKDMEKFLYSPEMTKVVKKLMLNGDPRTIQMLMGYFNPAENAKKYMTEEVLPMKKDEILKELAKELKRNEAAASDTEGEEALQQVPSPEGV